MYRPPTAGFVAKWYIFSAAVSAGDTGLAIIGVLTSVVSYFSTCALSCILPSRLLDLAAASIGTIY